MFRLRGHHLLCLPGYRGMGYSPEYVANMTRLHQALRQSPNTEIVLVEGPDDLCKKFPNYLPYHCEDTNIYQRDAAILAQLGVAIGEHVAWGELEKAIAQNMIPNDIHTLCHTCSWRSYGVCVEGLEDIRSGKGLYIVE